MKKILTLLLLAMSVQLFAQNVITGIIVNIPANPDANTANWGSGASVFTISAATTMNNIKLVLGSKILVTIKKGGSRICGSYTSTTAPEANFNTTALNRVWNGQNAVSLLGQDCVLKPGDYELCVQFFGAAMPQRILCEEVCKPFSIKAEDEQTYQAPQLISPADGTVISKTAAKSPVTFRWVPVVPKPKVDVVYKVRIIEIRKGQTATSAMQAGGPIFEKEVINQTQLAGVSLSQLPIAKDSKYGWYVQALSVQAANKAGFSFGENNGTSGPASFMVGENDIDIYIDSLKVECCANSRQLIKLTIRNGEPNTNTILRKLFITAVNGNSGLPYPLDISSSVIPPLPFSFLPSSTSVSQGRKNFTASVPCNLNMNILIIKAYGDRVTGLGTVDDNDLEADTLQCRCTDCDSINLNLPEQGTFTSDSTLWMTTPVSASPGIIKSIKAQLVYFEHKPESDDCVPCNRDSKDWGNFISATLSDTDFNNIAILNYGHEVQWNSTNGTGSNLNGIFKFNISLPPLVKCCKLNIKFCIRYIFEFEDCIVCEKLVCYTHSITTK